MSRRFYPQQNIWGKDAPRRFFGSNHWSQPMRWHKAASWNGVREKVFCSSFADVFEQYTNPAGLSPDPDIPGSYVATALRMERDRQRLWGLIERTPSLDWLLLTKRPQNILKKVPVSWRRDAFPPNVWLGVTVAEPGGYWRWRELQQINAAVRFISYEPALAPIDIREMCAGGPLPDWVIIGGESGHGARPFNIESMCRWTVLQCEELGIVPFVKQFGDNAVGGEDGAPLVTIKTAMGKEMSEWPEDTRKQAFPTPRPTLK